MQIIVLLIIISLLVAGGFLFAFFWAVKNGQYEDDFTPSMRLLVEEDMLQPTDIDQSIHHNNKSIHGNTKPDASRNI